jgi:putative transposase
MRVHLENGVSVGRKFLHAHPNQGIAQLVQRVYRYRLYPTSAQSAVLARTLILLRTLYNACLQERRDAWQKQRISVTKKMQAHQLRSIRDGDAEYKGVHFHLLSDVVLRCDRAFQAFFRRVKAGETAGFPRFKGRDFYKSFTFADAANRNGAAMCAGGKRLYIHGVGNVKIKLHRAHEGKLKQIRVLRLGDGHWYADFVCADVPQKLLAPAAVSAEVGIDLGITTYAAMSDGASIKNPRYGREGAAELAAAQRKLSACKRGSNRRRKNKTLVAKHHLHVARQRLHFQHTEALGLLRKYQTLYVEDLNVKGLAAGMLAKSVSDAAWGQFIDILVHKAESAGREVVKVNPNGTSQRCSACDANVPKDLSVRVHRCACGYVADRDLNAARNILRLGQSLREVRHAA